MFLVFGGRSMWFDMFLDKRIVTSRFFVRICNWLRMADLGSAILSATRCSHDKVVPART